MKKCPKKEALLLPQLLKKIAPKIGAKVVIEPRWSIVGQITFRNGKKSYFRYNTLDLNPVGSSDVAKDKDYATFFMKKMGYPTVSGRSFFSPEWSEVIGSTENTSAALRYATRIGFPVFAKPNSGSQGADVYKAQNIRELRTALKCIFKHDRVALVQKPVAGCDYRVVVLDDKVISAYERIPLNVIGDGRSTITQLLKKKQKSFIAASRDTRIKLNDPRLKYRGRSSVHVPAKGEQIFLLDIANLSAGGDAVDVTKHMHPDFKKLAIKLTKDMGLRLCGVDFIVDGSISDPPKKPARSPQRGVGYWILEVNASPGLDHYVKTGEAQQKIVEAMYLKILKAIDKD